MKHDLKYLLAVAEACEQRDWRAVRALVKPRRKRGEHRPGHRLRGRPAH